MGKPTICIGKNKGADQLRSNCEADQRLCFRHTSSTIPLLLKSEISSFWPASVAWYQLDLVGNPNCWFSHAVVQLLMSELQNMLLIYQTDNKSIKIIRQYSLFSFCGSFPNDMQLLLFLFYCRYISWDGSQVNRS